MGNDPKVIMASEAFKMVEDKLEELKFCMQAMIQVLEGLNNNQMVMMEMLEDLLEGEGEEENEERE